MVLRRSIWKSKERWRKTLFQKMSVKRGEVTRRKRWPSQRRGFFDEKMKRG